MKCDIIIPIYNSLNWVKMCITAVYENTNACDIGEVILINDKSDKETTLYLRKISKQYFNIRLIENKKNLGFVKSCNYGMSIAKSDYILLLNSDCLLSKDAVGKMMRAMQKDKKIGLLCPISSKAANISFPLLPGYNYQSLNTLFEKKFKGKMFDACTVVGNCLMISKECINKTGVFDEVFGKGYTEETDYQFKAHAQGFKAKVLIDTYVFHECRVSFGESDEQLAIRKSHLDIFFKRWGEEYNKKMEKYKKSDPIEFIHKKLDKKLNKPNGKIIDVDTLNVELINYINRLIIDGIDINVSLKKQDNINEVLLFSPIIKDK
ncbi:MAG: glycosyltransferase [Bacilli bacterium]|nr:glycosyltransferase [Bacilli bacterium]